MAFADALNPAQLAAVTAKDGPVLVIAGAGSGKTRTIVHRLAWLADQGVPPPCMLLLTFTRKAGAEMLRRAADLLGQNLGGVHGGTFHGFAFSVLRRHRPAWAEGPITVMDASDTLAAMQECKERLKIGKGDRSFPKTQHILGLLSKARNKELDLLEVLQRESPHLLPHADALIDLGKAYAAYRREHALLDYDDLLFELEALLTGNAETPGLAPLLRTTFTHIMVDEYQDTNRVQARLVRLLAGENGNVMAVGDDAQSIYAFRGATVRNILDFPTIFPCTEVIRLEENYRSVQPVLDVANAVLARAKEGYTKHLFTRKTGGRPVRLIRPLSDLTQASLVAARVEELLESFQPGEIAVLFRAGYQSYHLEVALAKRGIAFRKYGGLRYTEAAHVKDVLSFVRLTINPLDMPSLQRMAALCKGVGPRTAQKLYAVAARGNPDDLRKACLRFPDLWADFELLDALRQEASDPAGTLDRIIEHYRPRLEKLYPDDWPRRLQGLEEMAHIASSYTDLETFVAELSLETPEEAEEREGIVLSTIHSAKGLEWDAVILLDLVEERFPSRHALLREEDFEEERRLMYVACTRAREALELSVPLTLYNRREGGNTPAVPSPFVRDLPPGLCEEWQEGYSGQLARRGTLLTEEASCRFPASYPDEDEDPDPSCGPVIRRAPYPDPAENVAEGPPPPRRSHADGPTGFCRHKIFGRGKIVEHLPPDKCRVHFPGVGLKVILTAYLSLEE